MPILNHIKPFLIFCCFFIPIFSLSPHFTISVLNVFLTTLILPWVYLSYSWNIVKVYWVRFAQLRLTLCNTMDCSPPGSSVHGIFQARILEWFAIPFSRGSSWPRDRIQIFHVTGRLFTIWATNKHIIKHLKYITTDFSSVQFSHSVMSDSLQPHGLQYARLPCPSPTPRACSNSCPLNLWCDPTISFSVIPFSSCLQSFPASEFFQGVSSSHQVTILLEFQLQHPSFQWTFRTDFL